MILNRDVSLVQAVLNQDVKVLALILVCTLQRLLVFDPLKSYIFSTP